MGYRQIKILYIITLPIIGGAQVHLNDIISNLSENIVPYVIVGQDGWLVEKLQERGCEVFIVKSLVRNISLVKDLRAIFECISIIRKIRPDLVHCHSSKAGIIGRVVAKICNVPAIFTAHGWAFTEGVSEKKRWIYKYIESLMAKYVKKIICVSKYDYNLACAVMPSQCVEKLLVMHNGVPDLKEYKKSDSINDNYLRLVMVARFCPPKQQIQIIAAVNELAEVYPDIMLKLTLIGDGPEYEIVQQYAKVVKHSKAIEFLGAKDNVVELLFEHHVFILISDWEGLPLSILEAMRQGLPVIASDVGGIPEAAEDEVTGYLIPRGDQVLLQARIYQLYKNRDLCCRLGEAGRQKYINEFTSETMMRSLLNVYEEVIQKK